MVHIKYTDLVPSDSIPSRPPADALAQGNVDAAAQLIAGALPGNALAINTAATLAPAEGLTTQLAQASSLAVTKYGADATAVAAALSEVGGSSQQILSGDLQQARAWERRRLPGQQAAEGTAGRCHGHASAAA